jgi:iron-sulfur cluster assembly accessory protein
MGFGSVSLVLHALRGLFGVQPRDDFSSGWNGESRQPSRAPAGQKSIVRFTPKAIAELHKAQQEERKPYLRVGVVRAGPTGYMYDMKFDDRTSADDYTDNVDGITVVVNRLQALYIEGSTVDWQTTEDGRQGFVFDNPNAEIAPQPN